MPLVIPLTYLFLLPRPIEFTSLSLPEHVEEEEVDADVPSEYVPLPSGEDGTDAGEASLYTSPMKASVSLTARDKLRLVRPLLLKYMLPLCKLPSQIFDLSTHRQKSVCVYTVSLSSVV